jgi:DNA-binding response OmpR family regulator
VFFDFAQLGGFGDVMPSDDHDVLVVEDDPEINELLGAYAQICGFSYRSALNGNEALAAIRNDAPALVVLDVMLPDMSGFDICQRIRQAEPTSATPIIMLTALDTEECRQRGKLCGATEYLTKPFDPDTLMAAMKAHRKDE